MEFSVKLLLNDDKKDILRFILGDKDYETIDIDLNSEDQTSLENLFYEIIKRCFDDNISFKLDSDEHEKDLIYDVAVDYIAKLNEEITKIRSAIPTEINKEIDDEN